MTDPRDEQAQDAGLRTLLRIRDFRFLWFGQIVSLLAMAGLRSGQIAQQFARIGIGRPCRSLARKT